MGFYALPVAINHMVTYLLNEKGIHQCPWGWTFPVHGDYIAYKGQVRKVCSEKFSFYSSFPWPMNSLKAGHKKYELLLSWNLIRTHDLKLKQCLICSSYSVFFIKKCRTFCSHCDTTMENLCKLCWIHPHKHRLVWLSLTDPVNCTFNILQI